MTDNTNLLLVTVDSGESSYEAGLEAIRTLENEESVDEPATVTFANEKQLGRVFNDRTFTLLRTIRADEPASIRETARLVDRDVKNVHEELTTLEALGVVRFEDEGQSKQPVFPYDDLVISPLGTDSSDSTPVAP